MKIPATKLKIKKQSKKISGMISELKKEFFALEVMQSKWEADHGLVKPIDSVDEYITRITKSA